MRFSKLFTRNRSFDHGLSLTTIKENKDSYSEQSQLDGTEVLSVKITNPLDATMTSTPSTSHPEIPLSIFVLLPASAHSNQPAATTSRPVSRPSPLKSRQSGSTIPSLKSLSSASSAAPSTPPTGPDIPEIDKVVSAGRRLSLAPGIGAGTQTRSQPLSRLEPVLASPTLISDETFNDRPSENVSPLSPASSSKAPAFGARSSAPAARGRRRPQTATTISNINGTTISPVSRGSIAIPNLGSIGSGKTRPGWEGDEVVGMLRASGLEVTIIRHAAQLPSILGPSSSNQFGSLNQQQITAHPTTSTPLTTVILVPLQDSPTIPSLSLLLQQGTTPTAVCFQQDLLDRAKRSEEEWLPSALAQIQQLIQMRQDAQKRSLERVAEESFTPQAPIILAYSANPALSPNTIAACISAGASGVLKPPYDLDTARLVRRMVRAAREGRVSSVAGYATDLPRRTSHAEGGSLPHKVVLPPTALSMGGEHEGEKVLSGAYRSHRRGKSADDDIWTSGPDYGRSREPPAPIRRSSYRQSQQSHTSTSTQNTDSPTTARTPIFPEHGGHADHRLETLLKRNSDGERRRRSVDIGGLGIALKRAQKAFEVTKPGLAHSLSTDSHDTRAQRDEAHDPDACQVTQFAELLSAMFYQTLVAIDIRMDEYAACSAPISQQDRERLIDAVSTWSFKPHFLEDSDLYRLACILFDGLLHSEGLAELKMNGDPINQLLFAIRAIYHAPNPYHNYVHAIDVLQATYSFLVNLGLAPPYEYIRSMGPDTAPWKRPLEQEVTSHGPGSRRARQVFRPQDVFAILLAAMGHDVGHPGLSNAFMKNAKTPLSQVFDDKSVLENMHCMLIVQLLRKHGFSFLIDSHDAKAESIPARVNFDNKGFRCLLYSSVLATDMSLHFVWMQTLQTYGEKISHEYGVYGQNDITPGGAVDDDVQTDRVLIAQALIKCADISNPTRPIDVSEHWSTVLLKEWAVQASLETDLELPVSVIASADAALQAKGQIGFIKLFTQPLFDAVSDVLPEMQRYADWCAQNCDIWETRSEKLKEQEVSVIVQPAVEDASGDERFSTLFPLSLPTSLVEARSLEPGPISKTPTVSTNSTLTGHEQAQPQQQGEPQSATSAVSSTTPKKVKSAVGMENGRTMLPSSPSAKAIRVVYHANTLDQRHRLSSWTRGVPVPGLTPYSGTSNQRRSSTPAAISTLAPQAV